jgi:hypothetical protein
MPGRRLHLPLAQATIHVAAGGYKVNSPARVDGRTAVFAIKNNTKVTAYVILPPDVGESAEVPPGETGRLALFSGVGGKYSYAVLMETSGGLVAAQGQSDPVIIIDPPCS